MSLDCCALLYTGGGLPRLIASQYIFQVTPATVGNGRGAVRSITLGCDVVNYSLIFVVVKLWLHMNKIL
jgi:hypothetical protein